MSGENYYRLCGRNRGRAIEIRDRRGRAFRGRIGDTHRRGVYLNSLDGSGGFFFPFLAIASLIFLSALFF